MGTTLVAKSSLFRDFPASPVVKTLPSKAGGSGSIPGWGAKIPYASWPRSQSIKHRSRASLKAQWWRIHLPMQEMQAQSLIWEYPMCCKAAVPLCHLWASALDSGAKTTEAWVPWSSCPAAREAAATRGPYITAREQPLPAATREKPGQQRRPGMAKNKLNYKHIWKLKAAQLCPTLCEPVDYTVHEIPQARILEREAIPFSRDSSQPRDQTRISCIAGGFFTSLATGIYIYRSNIVTNSIKSLKSDPHFKKIFKKKNFFKKQPF